MSDSQYVPLEMSLFIKKNGLGKWHANQYNKYQMWNSAEMESGLVGVSFFPLISILLLFFQQAFHISRQTFREFNHYVVVMVNCLWNSKMCHPGMGIQLGEELLRKSNVPQYWASFDLIYHPAFMSYAVDFHQKVSVDQDFFICVLQTYLYRILPDADHKMFLVGTFWTKPAPKLLLILKL